MICNWCGEGEGKNRTTDPQGKIYYYYCYKCVGNFRENPFRIRNESKNEEDIIFHLTSKRAIKNFKRWIKK